MLTDLFNTNAAGVPSPHLSLRLVPAIKPIALIAEDHDDSREMLRILLERKNWIVCEARDGIEAVEMAYCRQPKVILMDGSLPLIDGLEATRRIRRNEPSREVFILAMNGWGTPDYHLAALAAGCNDSLIKPIDFELLDSFLAPFSLDSSQATAFHAAQV